MYVDLISLNFFKYGLDIDLPRLIEVKYDGGAPDTMHDFLFW